MTRLQRWLADLPTTNARVAVTIVLNVITVLTWLVACVWLGKPEPGGLDSVLTFLAVLSGVDVAAYFTKRRTFKNAPPAGADVEDAPAKPPAAKPAAARASLPADLQHALRGAPPARDEAGDWAP